MKEYRFCWTCSTGKTASSSCIMTNGFCGHHCIVLLLIVSWDECHFHELACFRSSLIRLLFLLNRNTSDDQTHCYSTAQFSIDDVTDTTLGL